MVIAVPGVPLQCLYLRRIFGRWAPVRVIAPSAGGASMMGTASRRSQGRSAFLHPSTGRLEPRRSLQLSQVFESVFLREGTRLRRVGGAREAQATKGCRACFVGLRRSLARNAPPTRPSASVRHALAAGRPAFSYASGVAPTLFVHPAWCRACLAKRTRTGNAKSYNSHPAPNARRTRRGCRSRLSTGNSGYRSRNGALPAGSLSARRNRRVAT